MPKSKAKQRGRPGRPKGSVNKKSSAKKEKLSSSKKKRKREADDAPESVDSSKKLGVSTDPMYGLTLLQQDRNNYGKSAWLGRIILLGCKYVLVNEGKLVTVDFKASTTEFVKWCEDQVYYANCIFQDQVNGHDYTVRPSYYKQVLKFMNEHFTKKPAPKEWLWEWHEDVTWYIEEISEYVAFPKMYEINAMLRLVHKADGICCEKPPPDMLRTPIKKEPIETDKTDETNTISRRSKRKEQEQEDESIQSEPAQPEVRRLQRGVIRLNNNVGGTEYCQPPFPVGMVLKGKSLLIEKIQPATFESSTGISIGYMILSAKTKNVASKLYQPYLPAKVYFTLHQAQMKDKYEAKEAKNVETINKNTVGKHTEGNTLNQDVMVIYGDKERNLTVGGNDIQECQPNLFVNVCSRKKYVKEANELKQGEVSELILPNCLPSPGFTYIGQVYSKVITPNSKKETGFYVHFSGGVFGFAQCKKNEIPSLWNTVSVKINKKTIFTTAPSRMEPDGATKDVIFNAVYEPPNKKKSDSDSDDTKKDDDGDYDNEDDSSGGDSDNDNEYDDNEESNRTSKKRTTKEKKKTKEKEKKKGTKQKKDEEKEQDSGSDENSDAGSDEHSDAVGNSDDDTDENSDSDSDGETKKKKKKEKKTKKKTTPKNQEKKEQDIKDRQQEEEKGCNETPLGYTIGDKMVLEAGPKPLGCTLLGDACSMMIKHLNNGHNQSPCTEGPDIHNNELVFKDWDNHNSLSALSQHCTKSYEGRQQIKTYLNDFDAKLNKILLDLFKQSLGDIKETDKIGCNCMIAQMQASKCASDPHVRFTPAIMKKLCNAERNGGAWIGFVPLVADKSITIRTWDTPWIQMNHNKQTKYTDRRVEFGNLLVLPAQTVHQEIVQCDMTYLVVIVTIESNKRRTSQCPVDITDHHITFHTDDGELLKDVCA